MSFFDKFFGGNHGGNGHGGGHGNGHGGHSDHSAQNGNYGNGPPQGIQSNGVACANCRVLNAAGARFCVQCGSSMAPAQCKQCNATLQPGSKFCNSCGKATA